MKVYKQYDQQELDFQYNTRLQVPHYAEYFDRWEQLSQEIGTLNTFLKDIPFGDHVKERLDIFPSKIPDSKTLVFIHGGYWHLLDKAIFHFLAEPFLKENVTTVFINYPLAPEYSIHEIVTSCQHAMRWVHNHIKLYNGDPAHISVMGHSAGGHLAVMLLTEQVHYVRGVISLSGIFRLKPVMLSHLNASIGMDDENAMQNSPVFLTPANDCPLLLLTGSDESDEFRSQSKDLYESWKSKHKNTELLMVPEKNHYSILDAVTEKDSDLIAAILGLMHVNSENS